MSYTILIVDDEEAIRFSLSEALAGEGYQVMEAQTGTEGMEMIKERRPDMVLLDLRLPNYSGMDMLKEIKKHKLNTMA